MPKFSWRQKRCLVVVVVVVIVVVVVVGGKSIPREKYFQSPLRTYVRAVGDAVKEIEGVGHVGPIMLGDGDFFGEKALFEDRWILTLFWTVLLEPQLELGNQGQFWDIPLRSLGR